MRRGRLRLVEHDHAVGQVMQLAAARRAVREQALEELHRRCYHHWRIPIFRGQAQCAQPVALVAAVVAGPARRLPFKAGVVLQDSICPDCVAVHLRRLLDNHGERHHDHHAPLNLGHGVFEREGE